MKVLCIDGREYSEGLLATQTLSQLAIIHNACAELVEARKVDRFANKEVAVRRTWGLIVQANALEATMNAKLDKSEESAKPMQEETEVEEVAATEKTKVSRGQFKGKTIRALVGNNPRRAETHGWRSMQVILNAPAATISYEDYIAQGGRNNDLAWDLKHNRVVIF